MGLAVYNSINLDIHFPAICYKKLLSPAVVPYRQPQNTVGVCPVTLDDLQDTKPVGFNANRPSWLLLCILRCLLCLCAGAGSRLAATVATQWRCWGRFRNDIPGLNMLFNWLYVCVYMYMHRSCILQISFTEFGVVKTHELKENGENIPVTDDNKTGMSLFTHYFLWVHNLSF